MASATVPGVPTGLTVNNINAWITQSPFIFSWTAPANNGGSSITGYLVTLISSADPTRTIVVASTTHTLTYALVPANASQYGEGRDYQLTVQAQNAIGTGAAASYFFATYID